MQFCVRKTLDPQRYIQINLVVKQVAYCTVKESCYKMVLTRCRKWDLPLVCSWTYSRQTLLIRVTCCKILICNAPRSQMNPPDNTNTRASENAM